MWTLRINSPSTFFRDPSSAMSCPPPVSLQNCSISTSYIRPDQGLAIMPWVYSAVLFAGHIASFITRVFLDPIDRSQLLTILLATYAISITILTYQSTRFTPEKIYIWTPLMLGGDAASLIHLIRQLLFPDPKKGNDGYRRIASVNKQFPDQEQTDDRDGAGGANADSQRKLTKTDIVCLIISIILLVTVVVLQGAGMVFSISQFFRRNQLNLQTTWCSPAFQLGNETFNSECQTFPIIQHENLGIACVNVAGDQPTWLGWTAVGLILFLIFEITESAILFIPKFQKIRKLYRAPVMTTLAAIIVWFAFIMLGWSQMKRLPPGLSESRLGIVSGMEGTCGFDAVPGGLRGTIIAWSDAVFESWPLYQ